MTREELIESLSGEFYPRFAGQASLRICAADAVGMLYDAVTGPLEGFPRSVRHKVRFRGAYVLERIFFDAPERFAPFVARFCRDFPACADPSARRHFAKIMAHLLRGHTPDTRALERIAEAAAEWAVDPGARVAVRVWAMEVLARCRDRVGWVAEAWSDLMETVAADATPGIASRMRRGWK